MSETRSVDPKSITVADRLREVDEDIVEAIRAVGLRDRLHPIIVRSVDGELQLVAGAHRLEAALRDGRETITVVEEALSDDDARLVEIEENIVRKGLKGLERAHFLAEWKGIYERRHPAARKGAHGHNKGRNETGIFPFSSLAARKLGCDRSTVEKSVGLFTRLTAEVRHMIAGTRLAEKDSELRALAKVDPGLQRRVAMRMLRADKPCATVKKALDEIEQRTVPSAEDRQFFRLLAAWDRAGQPARSRFVAMLRDSGKLEV